MRQLLEEIGGVGQEGPDTGQRLGCGRQRGRGLGDRLLDEWAGDGAKGAEFLSILKGLIEDPLTLLL